MFDNVDPKSTSPQQASGHGTAPGSTLPPIDGSAPSHDTTVPGFSTSQPSTTPPSTPQSSTPTSNPGSVDDIFVHTDRSQGQNLDTTLEPPSPLHTDRPSPFKPVGDPNQPSDAPSPYMAAESTPPPIADSGHNGGTAHKGGSSKRKYFIIGLIGLAVIAGSAFAWWFFTLNSQSEIPTNEFDTMVQQQEMQPIQQQEPIVQEPTEPLAPDVPPPTEINPDNFEYIPPTEPIDENTDSDADGLTDIREQELGTNPFSNDSDYDGLFDKEEIEIYETDPLNHDTDGDGFTDGEEVRNNYNPKGPGKLLP